MLPVGVDLQRVRETPLRREAVAVLEGRAAAAVTRSMDDLDAGYLAGNASRTARVAGSLPSSTMRQASARGASPFTTSSMVSLWL